MSEKKRKVKPRNSVAAPKAAPKIYMTAQFSQPTSESSEDSLSYADGYAISFRVHFSSALAVINNAVETFDFGSVAYFDACRKLLENISECFDAHTMKDRPAILQFVADGAPMLELLGNILASRLEALKKEMDPLQKPFPTTRSFLQDDETYILASLLACVSFARCHRMLMVLEKEVVHPT